MASTALAVALGGTAVALSQPALAAAASIVNIADPSTPANVAKVDTTGRLQVAQSPTADTSTIATSGSFSNLGVTAITSPTKANLVVNAFSISETRLNTTLDGSDLYVRLVQTQATNNTTCGTTIVRYLTAAPLSSGAFEDVVGTSRIAVKPISGQAYCVSIASSVINGAADATPYYPTYDFAGSVTSGTYTGSGSSGQTSTATTLTNKE